MVKVQGKAYDPATADWTKVVEYDARDREEAANWIKMNRDWFKDLQIVEPK